MMRYSDLEKPLLLTPEMLKQWNASMEEEKEDDAEYYQVYWHSRTTPKEIGNWCRRIENEEEWFQQREFPTWDSYLDFKDKYLEHNVGRGVYQCQGNQGRELEKKDTPDKNG